MSVLSANPAAPVPRPGGGRFLIGRTEGVEGGSKLSILAFNTLLAVNAFGPMAIEEPRAEA